MPDLCLTGTQHPFQIPGMAGAEAFEAALETYVDSISVMAIAEEMSLAGLARRKANESIAKRVADRKGLCHWATATATSTETSANITGFRREKRSSCASSANLARRSTDNSDCCLETRVSATGS